MNEGREIDSNFKTLSDIREYLDPMPQGKEAQREYVAKISTFFVGGLDEQIKHMIQRFKNQLALFPLSEREADYYRAAINFSYLLLEWGEEMVSAHRSNIKGEGAMVDAFEDERLKDYQVEN